MRTRSNFYSSNSTEIIPIRSYRRRIPNIVEPEIRTIVEIVLMVDRTMEELLQAPTEGYGEAIVISEILTENFEIKTNLLQDVSNDAIKLMLFSYSLEGAARIWYEKEPPNSILTWDDLLNKFVNQFFPPSKTTHLKNEISRFTQRFETFGEAWDHFKEMLRACPHHGFSELTQIDTFYNGLTEQDQDSVNATAGGNLLNKTTREALKIIENKSKVRYSRSKSNVSRVNTNSRDVVSKTDHRIDKLADQISNLVKIVNKQVIAPAKSVEKTCVTCGGAHAYYECIATDSNLSSVCAATGSYNQVSSPNRASHQIPPLGFAPVQNNPNRFNQNQGQGNYFNQANNFNQGNNNMGNNFQNNQGYRAQINNAPNFQNQGPSIPTESPLEKIDEQNTEEILDKEHSNSSGSTAQVQPPVVPISIPEPDVSRTQTKPTILYPSSLLTNKDKLFELAKVPLNENCSAMLLKKLPEKLGDPGKFLIPCDFPGMEVCHALADLRVSINLMPLSIWKKLSLPELTPTRMTLELADMSITRPKGVAEDVFVKVEKFHFLTDFVVVDFEADPRVLLILERSFLRTDRALIDVYAEEITLRVNDESVTFNLNQIMRYSMPNDDNSVKRVNVINIASEEVIQDNPKSSNPTLVSESDFCKDPIVKTSPFGESDFFLKEIEDFLNDKSIPTGIDNSFYDPEGDILYLENLLKEDPFQLPPMNLNQAKSPIEEPEYSLSMGYEHRSTTPKTKLDEVAESSVKNLVPIQSEYEVTSDNESEYEVPVKDDSSSAFTNPLFNDKDDFTSNDNESIPEEDVPIEEFKDYSNPLFNDDEINSNEIDSHCLNIESNFVESLSNHDTLKFDYLKEFSGALMPIRIAEEERIRKEHAEYISLIERLITINPCPRPMENANLIIESLPSSPIAVQDSNSQREEIDIVTGMDELLPLSFKNNDYDSEGEIDVVEELLVDNFISSSENKISYFDQDDPSFLRPPQEPPDVKFDIKPNSGEEISAVMNDNDELECFDPGGEINVFTNDEDDDYFPFIFVIRIFLPYLIYPEIFPLLLSAASEDTIFDPELMLPSESKDCQSNIDAARLKLKLFKNITAAEDITK
nr:reverse transcriptase domain-containing protein [Tanacetum cinerariifolium]